jgi:hypothetical protein
MPERPQYEKLYAIGKATENIETRATDGRIRQIAESYTANMLRVERLIEMLPNTVTWSINFQNYHHRAEREAFGPNPSDEQRANPELKRRKSEVFNRIFNADIETAQADLGKYKRDALQMGIGNLNSLVQLFPQMGEGLESVLASTITGAWTAFEVLAGDLWEASVNAHPDCMFPHLRNPDGKKRKPTKRQQTKSLELWDIRRHKWDLNGKVGTVLREGIKFTTLGEMRGVYRQAFRSKKVNKPLNNRAIDVLQIIRNCLVHKSGKIDAEFVEKAGEISELSDLAKQPALTLSPEFVAPKVISVVECAGSLISAVDRWVVHQGGAK